MGTMQDIRHAARVLLKNPGFTALAVLMLGLGIGASTTIFSVVDAVLLRPLPYQDPERIAMLWEVNVERSAGPISVPPADFLDWKSRTRTFESLAAMTS